ncbi:DAZ-associated protein 2 isoform X2 [Pristis pectinata]|uniref:DAZ-associated protein 2 isoform X2 n=1 Tax=Pristis pectinata TaxID=685728 RepID=UPI00223DD769|nr:DAZ-associated protein 2 isoform X2 [Pristis pectinata]
MSKKGAYPRQSSYPRQPAVVQPQCVPTVQFPQPPPYTEPPPSYAELQQQPGYVQVPPRMSASYPGDFHVPVSAQMQVNPAGAGTPIRYYVVPQVFPPQSTVLMEGGYDAGARFGTGATANLPPPPPGCPPNAAQIAAMQGGNVIVTQKKGSWLSGGSDGGYTIW